MARAAARDRAIRRGLEFIYRTACDEQNFADYGYDYLGCFHCLVSTSKDEGLVRMARRMGQERARYWRRRNAAVPEDANAIFYLILGAYSANRLGIRDKSLTLRLRRAAARFGAEDFYGFDPVKEPPPEDVPEDCACGAANRRGRKACRRCKKPLKMTNRYALYTDALVRSYFAERLGVDLGGRYRDVIKWLPAMRPYRGRQNGKNPDYWHAVYAVTHVVYTLNDYSVYTLSPRWLPDEYAFLKANLDDAIATDDPETMGELMDTLKGFGLSERHPHIRKGMDYLLATQNEDGSWGDMDAEDIYQRYHPTWTAVDGLREYAWRGERLSFPRLGRLLERANGRA
jgi:hypothetical protein